MPQSQSELSEVEPGRDARLGAIETEIARLTPKQLWDRKALDDLFVRVSETEKHDLGPAFLKIDFDTILEEFRRKNIVGTGNERLAHKFDYSQLFFNPENKDDLELNSKVSCLLEDLDSVSFDICFSRGKSGQELEILRNRQINIREQLNLLGVRIRERELLSRILTDFYYANAASKIEGALHDWSESGDEAKGSSTSFLHPLTAYLANDSVHNTWTTKVLLYCLLEAVGRPHLPPKWNSWQSYLEPRSSVLLYATLGAGVIFERLVGRDKIPVWLSPLWLLVAWAAGWTHLAWKRDRIKRRIGELMSHFARFNDTFLCDGDELVFKLREVERMGVYIPSLLYTLMRLAKPKDGEW